jgi:hypothetical protein
MFITSPCDSIGASSAVEWVKNNLIYLLHYIIVQLITFVDKMF